MVLCFKGKVRGINAVNLFYDKKTVCYCIYIVEHVGEVLFRKSRKWMEMALRTVSAINHSTMKLLTSNTT